MKLPPGFAPLTFRELLVGCSKGSPMLGPLLWKHLGLSEEEALDRIKTVEKKGFVQFAVSPDGLPSVFTANNIYTSAEEEILVHLLVDFWETKGTYNAQTGRVTSVDDIESSIYRVETPEGPLAIVATVGKKLLAMGLLSVDAEGHWHGPSKGQVMQWTQEHGICDFCSDPNPSHVEMVPDFEMENRDVAALVYKATDITVPTDSVGGWGTCDECHTMITENRRTDLLVRAVKASRGGKFTAAALKGLHKRFWQAMDTKVEAAGVGAALIDFIEDRISPEKGFVNPKLQQKAARKEAIRRLTGLTQDEMDALVKGDVMYKDVATKLAAWRKRYGIDTVGEEKVADMLNAFERPAVMPPHTQPHWQQAHDRKVEAIHFLGKHSGPEMDDQMMLPKELRDTYADMKEDRDALKVADVYSFNADTMHAIMAAAAKIPHEAPLRSIEVPMSRAGWYWFSDPYPVSSAPISSDYTHAVLWTWDTAFKEPTLRFSSYVVDEKGESENRGKIYPSAKWYWSLRWTFHEMIGQNRVFYRQKYDQPDVLGKDVCVGEDATIKVVADLSLFFMQSCQWFRETIPGTQKKKTPILTQTPGHIERHERKRYEKEFKMPPNVRVIALRKTERTILEESTEVDPNDKTKRRIKVRFVVEGHHRLQRCGPGLKDEKLIWIESYPKGPDDGPFLPPRDKVYAVIR